MEFFKCGVGNYFWAWNHHWPPLVLEEMESKLLETRRQNSLFDLPEDAF